jgi:hypothetical protein
MDEFRSYDSIAKWYSKVRDPVQGRPTSQASWCRVIRNPVGIGPGGGYEFYAHRTYMKEPFAVVKPDNSIEFMYTGTQVRAISNTLTGWLWRVLPFHVQRISKCRYNIVHSKQAQGLPWWEAPRKLGYTMYPGIAFDLTGGVCLNPKVIDTSPKAVDADKRKQWLRDLSQFKKNIKVRARIGAMDQYVQPRNSTVAKIRPDWTNAHWLDMLEGAIKSGTIPTDLLQSIVVHAAYRKWSMHRITASDIYDAVDDICKIASLDLRLRYGVIKETQDE